MKDVKNPEEVLDTEAQKVAVLKATAVRQAMLEVVGEQKDEIIKRATAKLSAMGITVEASDLGAS